MDDFIPEYDPRTEDEQWYEITDEQPGTFTVPGGPTYNYVSNHLASYFGNKLCHQNWRCLIEPNDFLGYGHTREEAIRNFEEKAVDYHLHPWADKDDKLLADIAARLAEWNETNPNKPESSEWIRAVVDGVEHDLEVNASPEHAAVTLHYVRGTGEYRVVSGDIGHGKTVEEALKDLQDRHTQEKERTNPGYPNNMPAGYELDRKCAHAMNQIGPWRQWTFVEISEYPDEQKVLIRRRWYQNLEVWAPSTNERQAMEVFTALAHDIDGQALLSFDGDCFQPPPWDCKCARWMSMAHGTGETKELAICHCLLDKAQGLTEQVAYLNSPEGQAEEAEKRAALADI